MFIEIYAKAGNEMKRIPCLLASVIILLSFCSCAAQEPPAQVAATTLPVFEFTARICEGTGITVTQLVTESVSCLHDYSLNVSQVRAAEAAELIVINGAGLEAFMEDILLERNVVDCSEGIQLIESVQEQVHDHSAESHETHHHDLDPHIWLSPENAMAMAGNICTGLSAAYPEHAEAFQQNLEGLLNDLRQLQAYGERELSDLTCRELITFHDGFGYLARSFDLTILEVVEEESGSEASAAELKHLIREVRNHDLPAVFTEALGSTSAARIIAAETGISVYTLDMAMHGEGYFSAMYHNISTLKGALE